MVVYVSSEVYHSIDIARDHSNRLLVSLEFTIKLDLHHLPLMDIAHRLQMLEIDRTTDVRAA